MFRVSSAASTDGAAFDSVRQDKLGWDGMGCCDMRIDEVEEEEEVEKKA